MPEGSGKHHSRRAGAYYTPAQIAEYIAHESIDAWINRHIQNSPQSEKANCVSEHKTECFQKLSFVKILDPAVGNGVFLLAAADYLLQLRCRQADVRDTEELRSSILATNLYGVDLRSDAVLECRRQLIGWAWQGQDELPISRLEDIVRRRIRQGNSLIGCPNDGEAGRNPIESDSDEERSKIPRLQKNELNPFLWRKEFPAIFKTQTPGFDIIVGNPPFGNLLTSSEKEYISRMYEPALFGSRQGTWNIAAQFLTRASNLLRSDGEIGFVLPNSIMRTKQFSKTRAFLATDLGIWKVVDEGNPFQDVTLEMVSVFCSPSTPKENRITVVSRRDEIQGDNSMPRNILRDGGIAVLYHDDLFEELMVEGEKGVISATRGRDIPSEYVREIKSDNYSVPYVSSGRSIRRYRFDRNYFKFASDTSLDSHNLRESQNSEFLLATKNKAYPRCVLKPRGVIHGGGVVKIAIHDGKMDPEVLGLVLNSRMIRYLCVRYLTNYAKLTTCLNTGIIEELPIVYPDHEQLYRALFKSLQKLHGLDCPPNNAMKAIQILETTADALVYDLYLGIESPLTDIANIEIMHENAWNNPIQLGKLLSSGEIREASELVLNHPEVIRIEHSPRMGQSTQSG